MNRHNVRLQAVAFSLAALTLLAGCAFPPADPAAFNAPKPALPAQAQPQPVPNSASQAVTDSALTPEQQALLARLPSRGAAPELLNDTWLNSAPLKLADLRGKVVIVEFWTFG